MEMENDYAWQMNIENSYKHTLDARTVAGPSRSAYTAYA